MMRNDGQASGSSGAKTLGLSAGLVAGAGATSVALGIFGIVATLPAVVVGLLLIGGASGLALTRALVAKSLAGGAETLPAPAERALLTGGRPSLEEMRRQLSKCKFLEKVEAEGTRAAALAEELLQRANLLRRRLSEKFEPGEITFSRYQDAVDAAVLALADQLMSVRNQLENLNARADVRGESFVQERVEVGSALERVTRGLAELGGLDEALNQIVTKGDQRDQLEARLAEVQNLAARAGKYSKGTES